MNRWFEILEETFELTEITFCYNLSEKSNLHALHARRNLMFNSLIFLSCTHHIQTNFACFIPRHQCVVISSLHYLIENSTQ